MGEIAPAELRDRLEAGEPLSVVDIREEPEYRLWHIPGATNLPVYDALSDDDDRPLIAGAERLPRDRPVVAVCRAGILSRHAVEVLESLGFEAATLRGGMRGWDSVWSEAPIAFDDAWPAGAVFVQVRRDGKGCLSYVIGARGEAAVVDPSVAPRAYLELARRAGLRITRVLETHVHADHLSRARELCRETGAELWMPATGRVSFPFLAVDDGRTIEIGGVPLVAVSTPGHTMESTCYQVADRALLTGDTLFVDAVGRPDLGQGDAGAEHGARMLFRSLHERVLPRSGDLAVYPAHHGRPLPLDANPIGVTLADARGRIELLRLGEEEFVRRVLASLREKPDNFRTILSVNEGKADLAGDPLELESGPNRCAAG
jgi:glyoxylase-like metal-dependent hydrolase (beta-lactamase superfamily II)/rhodanese-related sulfurtransferase